MFYSLLLRHHILPMIPLLLVPQLLLDVFEFWVFYLLDNSDDRNDEIGHKIEKDDGLDGN